MVSSPPVGLVGPGTTANHVAHLAHRRSNSVAPDSGDRRVVDPVPWVGCDSLESAEWAHLLRQLILFFIGGSMMILVACVVLARVGEAIAEQSGLGSTLYWCHLALYIDIAARGGVNSESQDEANYTLICNRNHQ